MRINEHSDAVDGVIDALREEARKHELAGSATRQAARYAETAKAMDKYGIVVAAHPTKKVWVAQWASKETGEHECQDGDFCAVVLHMKLWIEGKAAGQAPDG